MNPIQVPVSPASPENARSVCLLRALVLSSDALRMVAPRIAALDAAMIVKSFPVIPKRTSLFIDVRKVWSSRCSLWGAYMLTMI